MTTAPRLRTVARRDDVADLAVVQAFANHAMNPGRAYSGRDADPDGWDHLSMEGPHRSTWHLTGYRLVGQTDTRAVYVWRCAVNGTSHTRYCAAVVDVSRDPARIVTVHIRDYQPEAETTRAGAEEKAAAVLTELLAADLAAERAARDNLAKLPDVLAAELADDARAAWAAGRPGAPALSAVVMRELAGLAVGSRRALDVMHTWIDAYEAERDTAAAAALAGPDPVWLCGECYETVTGHLAQCEDGCNRHLDHTGACPPGEHDGETCQRCGTIDRLTSYDVENLDEEDAADLAVRVRATAETAQRSEKEADERLAARVAELAEATARDGIPREWIVTSTETITRRTVVALPAVLPEWADADEQAAYLLDQIGEPGETLSATIRLDVAEPVTTGARA